MKKGLRVGVFDSGVGGLTVLQAIVSQLKGGEFYYYADTAYAPYGGRSEDEIQQRALWITHHLYERYHIDALVVACNSATTVSIKQLRDFFPDMLIIGTEPGIKPAIETSQNKKIGVLATPATLESVKYRNLVQKLLQHYKGSIQVFEQACPGLVEYIEEQKLHTPCAQNDLKRWLEPMIQKGVDTIVLGCTHYPLAAQEIRAIAGEEITLIQTAQAIARHLINQIDIDRFCLYQPSHVVVEASGALPCTFVHKILKNSTIYCQES